MITTIYTAEKNTSFRKATKWFMDHEIPFRQVFISKETFTQEEIKKILQMTDEGLSGLIKRTADKELIEELPLSEALELLIDDPLLIRSPIICNKKNIRIGFHDQEIRTFIPREQRVFQQKIV